MNPAVDMVPLAVKFISSLVLVLGLMGLLLVVLRRLSNRKDGGAAAPIRILASRTIGVKKTVCMVQVPGRILVLGVAGDSIRLLSEIDDPDVVEAWAPETAGAGAGGAASFGHRLGRIMSRFGAEQDPLPAAAAGIFTGPAKNEPQRPRRISKSDPGV